MAGKKGTKKKIIKNTVKGSRKGSKWPPAVKCACLADMLAENNLHAIAKRHNVPESTLRSWYNKAVKEDEAGRDSIYAEARKDAAKRIAQRSTSGVEHAVSIMNKRLLQGDEAIARCEEIKQALLDSDLAPDNKEKLEKELQYLPRIGDYAVSNIARTLQSVGDKSAAFGQDSTPPVIQVILSDEVKKYAE